MSDDDPQSEAVPTWCRLDDDEAEQRREWMYEQLMDDFEGMAEVDDGVTLTFAGADETLASVAEFVRAESSCCPFATFEVVVEPPYERTRMTMTAPDRDLDLASAFRDELERAPQSS